MSSQQKHSKQNTFRYLKVPETGETVYSLLGRSANAFGATHSKFLERVTGQKKQTALLSSLPGYIKHISQVAPDKHKWADSRNIVLNNTSLPYFTYFDGIEYRKEMIKKLAECKESNPIALSLGVTLYPRPANIRHPKYCFSCLIEDLSETGVTYLHREHQLPGIEVCWKHGEQLNNGCEVCGTYPLRGQRFIIPGCCNCDAAISPLKTIQSLPGGMNVHRWLAIQSATLVNRGGTSCENIKGSLKKIIISNEITQGRYVDYMNLANAITERYGAEYLEWLNISVVTDGKPATWLRKILYEGNSPRRHPAIYYLLLIGVFFDSIDDFEQQAQNPTSITLLTPKGKKDPTNSSKLGKLPKETILKALEFCDTPPCGIDGIIRQLKISVGTLKDILIEFNKKLPLTSQAIERIGNSKLERIRKDLRNGVEKQAICSVHKISEWSLNIIELDDPNLSIQHEAAIRKARRNKHRKTLTNLLKKQPKLTRTDLQKQEVGTYEYLLEFDYDWFDKKLPPIPRTVFAPSTRKKKVDRKKLDQKMADKIETHLKSRGQGEKPKWITETYLLREVGFIAAYHQNKDEFPKVTKLIQKSIESREGFILRKLKWAIIKLRDRGESLSGKSVRITSALSIETVRKYSNYIIKTANEVGADINENSYFISEAQKNLV